MIMKVKLLLIDYQMGNLFSVKNALLNSGAEIVIANSNVENIEGFSHVILPGVGAFNDGMNMLRATGWSNVLKEKIIGKIPLLGICLGMQLFAEIGEEGGEEEGLRLISGSVVKGNPGESEKSLHVGWNSVDQKTHNPLFGNIPNLTDFYFVHSYHFIKTTESIATVNYFGGVPAAIMDEEQQIYGVQFHPEKSGKPGLKLLENFLSIKQN